MITVVHNKVLDSIDFLLDESGVDLLIATLQALKTRRNHIHLYATGDDRGLSMAPPYGHETIYGQLVLDFLPTEARGDARTGS